MIFSSVFFLYVFLPIVLVLYYVAPFKLKNLVLLIFSLIFYAWGEPVYVFLMAFSILINYVFGLEIVDFRRKHDMRCAKAAMIVCVAVDLLVLGFYKYYGFLISNINGIFHASIPVKELALPIGISFYTFQTLSYIVDVYWGNVKAQKNLISFGAYVTMFPQLIAGPIVRYADIEKQLGNRKINRAKFGEGAIWFIQGLGKKALIANNIGNVFDNIQAMGAANTSMLSAWIGAFAYTMQIYFDFGGYSDMAIGLGKMLGFEFNKNFDYPYISRSVTEFWRRWHISLGTWFREYVYIPLGGNRVSFLKHIRNLLIVWALTGLWHGAAWNFVAWGVYYGILLILEKYVLKDVLERFPDWAKHVYTLFLVVIGWMLFAAPSMGSAMSYIGTMFGIGGAGIIDGTGWYYLKSALILGVIAAVGSTPLVYSKIEKVLYDRRNPSGKMWVAIYYIAVLLIATAYLVNSTYNPFLYFRF